jgi:hypothetical protein
MIELKNSRTTYLGKASGGDKYALDAFIGAVQMREPEGQWQDIKPRLVRDDDGWHAEGVPYYAEIKDDGSRLFCPDRNERSKYLRLPGAALFSGLTREIVSNPGKLDNLLLPNQITMPAEWGEIRIIYSNTGMHFEILFRQSPPKARFGKDSPRILLDAEMLGLDLEQLLKSGNGIGVPRPRLIASNAELLSSENQEKWLDWSYKNGQLELGFDFGDLPFPILLKNTTIDVQVGAGANDGQRHSGTNGFRTTSDISVGYYNSPGYYHMHSFQRFLNITYSGTVDVSYISVYRLDHSNNQHLIIYGEDADNPAAPASAAEFDALPLTTASVAWTAAITSGWNNSPSLNTIFAELQDSYTISGDAVTVIVKNDGSTTPKYIRYHGYDSSTAGAPKLHIEYTSGGVTAMTSAETASGADGSLLLAAAVEADTGSGLDGKSDYPAALLSGPETGNGTDTASLPAALSGVLETGTGSELASLTMDSTALQASDYGGGIEAIVSRWLETTETGLSGESMAVTAALSRLESGAGLDAAMSTILTGDSGAGSELGALQKTALSGDAGAARDAMKSLIKTAGSASDMRLSGRRGQEKIVSGQERTPSKQIKKPSKGVNL